jgi:MFS transporter, PPP family, 3-phenylpropionic acid transporter
MAAPALPPDFFVKPSRFELRMGLLYAAILLPVGVHLPYFPLWLAESGFDATDIAFLLSAPMFLRLVTTPFITALADKVSDRANVLIATVAATVILSLGYLLEPTYAVVLVISVLIQIVWTPHGPLADSLALSGVRRFGTDYASIRKWGTVAFLAGNVGGGAILGFTGASAVPLILTAALTLTVIASLLAPRLGRPRQPSPLSAEKLKDAPGSMLARRFLLFIGGAALINASHGLMYGFGSIYWKSIGLSESAIGALWAAAVAAEIGVMLVYQRLFGRLSAPAILAIAGCAALLRWLLFPLAGAVLGGSFAAFMAVQALHALTAGLTVLGVPKMVAEMIGEDRLGAAQGLVFFANGLAMGLVTLVSGPLYASLGAAGFYVMAATALAGLGLIGLVALSPREPEPAEK